LTGTPITGREVNEATIPATTRLYLIYNDKL